MAEQKTAPLKVSKSSQQVKKPQAVVKRRKGAKKNVFNAIVHVSSSFNNTVVTVADERGEVISWCSCGKMNFKGARKSTPFAAQVVTESAMINAKEHGVRRVVVLVNGPGPGRDTALRTIAKMDGIQILHIKDVTPIPHNGCRPPKRRRV